MKGRERVHRVRLGLDVHTLYLYPRGLVNIVRFEHYNVLLNLVNSMLNIVNLSLLIKIVNQR